MKKLLASGAVTLLTLTAGAQAQSTQLPIGVSQTDDSLLLDVAINGLRQDKPKIFLRRNGVLHVPLTALKEWHIRPPELPSIEASGQIFVSLAALPGLRFRIDDAQQILILTIPTNLFEPNELSAVAQAPTLSETVPAGFINYDLSIERSRGGTTAAAFLAIGASDDWGLISNTMTVGHGAGRPGAIRLDSYYLRDNPGGLTRLMIGDSVTSGNGWSPQVRFGGIRYGTDFSLQPGLVTFPTPTFGGRTALPSDVELYVNDALRYRGNVGSGPFTLNQVPLVTGAGQVTILMRDAIGVERQKTSSYYVSSRLLEKGRSDYSLEAGAERQRYGIATFNYGQPFATGSYRHGVTDWLTLEGRAEVSPDAQSGGGGFNAIWPVVGEFGLATAVFHGDAGAGALYRVYFSRVAPGWSLSVTYQHATSNFVQLGIHQDSEKICDELQATMGIAFGRYGSLTAAYTDLRLGDNSRTRIASFSYNIGVGERAYLNLLALHSVTNDRRASITAGLGLTMAFGAHGSAYVQADNRNRLAQYRRTPPTQGGWGYRLAASQGDLDQQQADLRWRGRIGEATAQVARLNGEISARLLASGGLILADGNIFPTRRVEGGFAFVDVPNEANVRIYQDNRQVARTDAKGHAIVPDMRAYEENRISLAAGDLPLDRRMGSDTMTVVPRYFSGTKAQFAVAHDRPGTVVMRLADGQLLEAGTPVSVDNGREQLFSGYGGEVFINSIHDGLILDAQRPEGACRSTIETLPPETILPRLGPIPCLAAEQRE